MKVEGRAVMRRCLLDEIFHSMITHFSFLNLFSLDLVEGPKDPHFLPALLGKARKVVIGKQPVDSHDIFLRHKTTNRDVYTSARTSAGTYLISPLCCERASSQGCTRLAAWETLFFFG